MNLSTITINILNSVRDELKKEESIEILKKDILKPIIKHTMDELYPYIFKGVLIILFLFLFILLIIFMNLKIIFKNHV
jgi:hypothetical protein